jgi:ABC-2 type transport system permease protein
MAVSLKRNLATLRFGHYLGWSIEANWTHPLVFGLYSVVRPVFASLILVFIYKIVVRGDMQAGMFEFLYVGNAFFVYVVNTLSAIGIMVYDDREHYQMLKYIYLAPIRIYWYFLGRSSAQITTSTLGVAVTLAMGVLFFDLNLSLSAINWPLLIFAVVSGLMATLAIGILMAGIALVTAMHSFSSTEAVAGVFYLASGCIYPIDILPGWLQMISKVLPFTYWMELIRRSVIGERLSPSLAYLSNWDLVGIMTVSTAALILISHYGFQWCEHGARKHGKIDQKTDH